MTEEQKQKRNFRNSKKWKEFKKQKKVEYGNVDYITQYPLRKGWQLHHENLSPACYQELNDDFICCNRQTHEFIHWLFRYYRNDPTIIYRIEKEMERMQKINSK